MNRNVVTSSIMLLALLAGTGLLTCSPSGGGTEVPPGYVAGILYTEGGRVAAKTAVRFARITEQPAGKKLMAEQIRSAEMTLVTNDRGEIVFDGQQLDDGYYTVAGELNTLKSFRDSVLFSDGTCDSIFDTLRPTGSLTGAVKLHYGDDSRLASVYLPGIKSFYFITDTTGMFTIKNLAQGTYRARFDTKYAVYLPLDTTISIRSGHHDTLPGPINLRYLIQIQGFDAAYDTLMQSVTFSWEHIDSTTIGGYNLEIDNGYSRSPRVIPEDTMFTLYLNGYIGGRLSTITLNNNFMQNYTEWIYINARNVFTVRSIALPVDSVRTAGWVLVNNQLCVLRSSLFNTHDWSLCVYDKNGLQRSTTSLNDMVKQPLAIAAKGDTLYVLEMKNSDTLCIHPLLKADSLPYTDSMIVPGNGSITANFAFAPDGNVYVSQNLSTSILDSSGRRIGQVNNLATDFALSATGYYTYCNGINFRGKPMKLAHFKPEGDSLRLVDTPVYDTYGIYSDVPNIFTANNNGVICCRVDQSIFVIYRSGTREFHARLYFDDATRIADLLLTDSNELFILHASGRIDVADLSARIESFERN